MPETFQDQPMLYFLAAAALFMLKDLFFSLRPSKLATKDELAKLKEELEKKCEAARGTCQHYRERDRDEQREELREVKVKVDEILKLLVSRSDDGK